MADSVKALDIIVSAKDQASAVLSKISASVKQTIASATKAGGPSGFGDEQSVSRLARAFEITGKVRLGLESVNIAARLLKGDFEGAADASEKLPFGVGATSRALRETLAITTGIGDEIERANRATAGMSAVREIQVKLAESSKAARDQLAKMNTELERQIALIGKAGAERDREVIKQARDAATAQAKDLGSAATAQATADARKRIAELQTELNAKNSELAKQQKLAEYVYSKPGIGKQAMPQFNEERAEIGRIKSEIASLEASIAATAAPITEKVVRAMRTASEKARLELREAGNKAVAETIQNFAVFITDKLKAGKEYTDRLKDINAEAAQSLLRAMGRDNEAEMMEIERYWDKRIAAAETGAEKEALARGKAAAIEERKADHAKRKGDQTDRSSARWVGPLVSGAETRFGTGFAQESVESSRAKFAADEAARKQKETDDLKKATEEGNKTLERMLETLKDILRKTEPTQTANL